jgi:hypothetical protein
MCIAIRLVIREKDDKITGEISDATNYTAAIKI